MRARAPAFFSAPLPSPSSVSETGRAVRPGSNYDVTISRSRTSHRCMRQVNYSPACHLTKAPPGAARGMRFEARGARARNNILLRSRARPTSARIPLRGILASEGDTRRSIFGRVITPAARVVAIAVDRQSPSSCSRCSRRSLSSARIETVTSGYDRAISSFGQSGAAFRSGRGRISNWILRHEDTRR